jgi:pyrimidine operon attenuation protein/uracil phosphoribosyltransferase
MEGKIILEGPKMALTIRRLAWQLAEEHGDFSGSCLVGLQRTGVALAQRLQSELSALVPGSHVRTGKLDVTFYRDDFRRGKPLAASPTEMPFLVEDLRVVLVDDVLYTGRTIRAGMDALLHYGRPRQVELLVLIDRRFTRHLPIQADYTGLSVDTRDDSLVQVEWNPDQVKLLSK